MDESKRNKLVNNSERVRMVTMLDPIKEEDKKIIPIIKDIDNAESKEEVMSQYKKYIEVVINKIESCVALAALRLNESINERFGISIDDMVNLIDNIATVAKTVSKNKNDTKKKKKESTVVNNTSQKKIINNVEGVPADQQQMMFAASHNIGGFNINNFIANPPENQSQVPLNYAQPQPYPFMVPNNMAAQAMHTPNVGHFCEPLPHEGKDYNKVQHEVYQHFTFFPKTTIKQCQIIALYDLLHNKFLKEKMKEFNVNKMDLKQVDINDFANDPEIDISRFNTAFEMKCADGKHKVIILYNTGISINNCGCKYHCINVLKK